MLVFGPQAEPAYDTTQIAYTVTPYELAYFTRSEWAEKPAQMLRGLLVRTLERSRRFRAVVTPPYVGRAAYALHAQMVELRDDFTQEPPRVRLVMRVELSDGKSGRTLASRELEASEPMTEKSPSAGVAAANEAAARLLAEIARFVIENTG